MSEEVLKVETRITDLLNEDSIRIKVFRDKTGKLPAHFLKGDAPSELLNTLDADSRKMLTDILEQRGRFYEAVNEVLATMASRWIDDLSVKGPGGGANESLIWMVVDKCLAEERVWVDRQMFCRYSAQRMKFEIRNEMRKRSRRLGILQTKVSPRVGTPQNLEHEWDQFEAATSRRLWIIETLQSRMRSILTQSYLLGRALQAIADEEQVPRSQIDRLSKHALRISRALMIVAAYAHEEAWQSAESELTQKLQDLSVRGKSLSESGLIPLQVQLGLVRFRLGRIEEATADLKAAMDAMDGDCHSQCGCLLDGLALVGDWSTFEKARQKILIAFTPSNSLEECAEVLLALARAPFLPHSVSSSEFQAITPYVARINELMSELSVPELERLDIEKLRRLLSTMLLCDESALGLRVPPNNSFAQDSSPSISVAQVEADEQTQSQSHDEQLPCIFSLTPLGRNFGLHNCLRMALTDANRLRADWHNEVSQEIQMSPSQHSMTWLERIYWDGQLAIARHFAAPQKSRPL